MWSSGIISRLCTRRRESETHQKDSCGARRFETNKRIEKTTTFSVKRVALEARALRALRLRGLEETASSSTARSLIEADADGKSSHGLRRLSEICAAIERGDIKKDALLTIRKDRGLIKIDGGGGLAFPARDAASSLVADNAKQFGIGLALIANTRSISGRFAPVVEHLARDHGLIAFACANTPAYLAVPPNARPSLGTNPIAFAAPLGDTPIVVDMALAATSRGDIEARFRNGQRLEPGSAVDSCGRPTEDPREVLEKGGAQLAAGGLKGAFLALLVELLAGLLTNSDLATDSQNYHTMNRGQFLLAIDPGNNTSSSSSLAKLLAALPFVPGDRARAARARHTDTIDLQADLFYDLASLDDDPSVSEEENHLISQLQDALHTSNS